ncbi:hypothetical protein ACFQPF_16895 [Fictibacillus iocasae]|uniref:NERD domain-containing protein n=1 Tax=Fictibacillus iocasae TaxID=2715437 RepID=A0ABW2NVC0_9BACL
MAHLVKIQDCVSRYEKNLYHYQSAFIRLKKKRREDRLADEGNERFEAVELEEASEEKKTGIWRRLFTRGKEELPEFVNEENLEKLELTAEEKRQQHNDELYSFQLKWASSTVGEVSRLDPSFEKDVILRYLIEQVPDNYFVFYKPIVTAMNAPVELDIIIVGPADIWLIVWLEEEGILTEESKRFWLSTEGGQKLINPHISMQRMTQAVSAVLKASPSQLALKKAFLSKEAYMDVEPDWRKVLYIDKREFNEWLENIKKDRAPVKSQQLRFVSALLSSCVTNSLYREPEMVEEQHGEDGEEKEGINADSVE